MDNGLNRDMKIIGEQTSFVSGISFSEKEGVNNSVAFLRALDHRSDPKALTLNPRSQNDSGTIVTDLPMWGARACTRTFAYGNAGNIYQKTTGSWSKVHTAADSQGNGLAYFTADSALYYTQNTSFGRLLDACTGSSFYDDFLGSEGGAPTNTKSIDFELSSSMYASRADTTSTSITADLSLEAYLKPESLPSTNGIYTIISKWDEQSDERSYKFDITTSSNEFGNGSDGVLTISTNTTETVIDANFSATAGATTITLSNVTGVFAAGQKILLHQSRGTNCGQNEVRTILSVSGSDIVVDEAIISTYSHSATESVANKAQIRVIPQYTTVTINSGITYTCKAWDGLKGGILAFLANTSLTCTGTITASGKGFRGGVGFNGTDGTKYLYPEEFGYTGEGTGGASAKGTNSVQNGNGAGATGNGFDGHHQDGATGGSNGGLGTHGELYGGTAGLPGSLSGSADLTTITFGGGGGGGSIRNQSYVGDGGIGGGIIEISSPTLTISGGIVAQGGSAPDEGSNVDGSGGGGGGGGSILLKCQTATLGSSIVDASGGIADPNNRWNKSGGNGGTGRIAVYYSDSVTGTTTPTMTTIEDTNLSASDGYILRLLISSTGSNSETYYADITNLIDTSSWARWAVTWENTTSTANFYRNGTLINTQVGALTAIYNSTAKFAVATSFDSSGNAENFYDGLMDDVRVWNDVRTASELLTNNDQVLTGEEANLVAYYQFTSDVTDSQTSGLNDLTATNTPTYSNDIPFSGLTTRNDQDQGLTSGSFVNGYTLATSIAETATHRQTFVPEKDPQKSIIIDIDTVGTGNWTLTVHDSLNRVVAEKTIAATELYTGFYEFIFNSVWRPIIGASYHFHLTSTVADGIVDTTGSNDLETAYFTTHYQFLVSDEYHPIKEFLDFMVIGNERYLAKYEAGNVYNPHRLTFPSGYRVRCLAYWREFLVIGCWKGTAITDFDDGRIFFWDGVSDRANHSIPVPEGGVNAMFGTQDVLFLVAGYTGEILVYTGGGSATKFNKIPKLQTGEYVEIAPGSMDMWRSNIHMGVNLNTDSSTVHKGVYSIGSSNSAYPASLGFDYPTSLGDQTVSTVKTSMVFPSGQNLYVGWQNANAYGIDSINPTNDVYSDGTVELLISDLGQISKEKYPLIIRADFEPLASGESIRVKYKGNREDDWKKEVVSGSEVFEDTVAATEYKLRIPERVKELQVAADLRTTVATSPKLLGISVVSEIEESSAQNE